MSVVFSIIVAATDAKEPSVVLLEQLENEHVELLICTTERGCFDAPVLGAAIEQCSGKYTLILREHNFPVTEGWLYQLASMTNASELVGGAGYALLSSSETQLAAASEVEWKVAVSNNQRSSSSVGVDSPVALVEDFLFSKTDFIKAEPLLPLDFCDGDFVGRYSLRMKLGGLASLGAISDHRFSIDDQYQAINSFLPGYVGLFPINELGVRCWQKNANALRNYDEGIAASITEGLYSGVDLQFKQKQKGRIVVIGKENDVILSDTSVRMDKLPTNETLVLFGVGAGELIDSLLRDTDNELLIVEPEVKLVNYLWMRYDWARHVESGRLRYVPIANQHPVMQSITLMQTGRFLQKLLTENSQPTQVVRSGSYHLYTSFYKTLEVALNRFQHVERISKTWAGKQREVYDVTIVSPRCAIFVDLAECLHRLGVRTRILNVPDRANELTEDSLIQLLASLNVDASKLIVYRNRSFIEPESLTLAGGIDNLIPGMQLSWWWDVPNVSSFIDMQVSTIDRPCLAFAKEILPLLPERSVWLPPAAQSHFCTGDIYQGETVPGVSFVGQSRISLLKTQLKILSEVVPAVVPSELQSSFSNMQSMFEQFTSYGELYHCIAEISDEINEALDRVSIKMPAQVYYLKYILNMSGTAAFRVAAIEKLANASVPLTVYGDDEWVTSGVVSKESFKGVIERKDLRSLYERSQINLNLNFMQVSSTVNPKVLDIAAAGGRVLTDVRPELSELYPDAGIRPHSFDGLDSLLSAVDELLSGNERIDVDLKAIAEMTRAKLNMYNRAQWFIEHFSLIQ